MPRVVTLVLPSNRLGGEEFFDAIVAVESAPTAILDSSMGKDSFIMNTHIIDVNSPVKH